jgi:beta-aspartyl-dipeptidase (metallo-type)
LVSSLRVLRLLRGAEVLAPEPLGRCDVLVGGERILAVAPSLPRLPDALAVEEDDLTGRQLVPGLVDAHVHLGGGGGEAGPHTRVPALQAGELARAGVTTCVGLLGTDGTTRSIADLVARALGLRAEGLSAWCWTGSYELPVRTLTGSVRSDLVFVDPIIGVGELALSDHRSSQPTLDELLRVAADAHVGGMMSGKAGVVHLHMGDGRRGLELVHRAIATTELPARVFHPTHVNRNPALLDDAIALAKSGVTIDATAFPSVELDDGVDAADAIAKMLAEGVPASRITCSSDGGGCMPRFDGDGRIVEMGVGSPDTLAATLAGLLARDVPAPTAVAIFTKNVAELLRLPRKGRIAAGGDADLVGLDAAGRVCDVMARGRWWMRGGVQLTCGTFERIAP